MGAGAIAALVIAVVGTTASIVQQRKATKAQERARRAQEGLQREQNRQERLQVERRARAARASITAGAEAAGAAGGSGPIGGVASVDSQLASNFSFLNSQANLSSFASAQLQEAANRSASAGTSQALGNLGFSVFSSLPGKSATTNNASRPMPMPEATFTTSDFIGPRN